MVDIFHSFQFRHFFPLKKQITVRSADYFNSNSDLVYTFNSGFTFFCLPNKSNNRKGHHEQILFLPTFPHAYPTEAAAHSPKRGRTVRGHPLAVFQFLTLLKFRFNFQLMSPPIGAFYLN